MQNNFIVVVPVFNAVKFIGLCLDSILEQDYKRYKVIVVDDHSTDGTWELIKTYPVKSVRNDKHNGSPVANTKRGIDLCAKNKEDIIVIVDGDDCLAGDFVLWYLNEVYQGDIWLTYGQYYPLSGYPLNWCRPVPDTRTYRKSHEWYTTALRTFKRKLWDKIDDNDLRYNGEYAHGGSDRAYMYPMIEMAGKKHIKFIDEILYIYNDIHPNNFIKDNGNLQGNIETNYIISKPIYKEL